MLLQSVAMQVRRIFWHILSYKVRQSSFITKCDRPLLQSASGIKSVTDFITKCVRHYKLWQLLESET